MAGSIPGPMGAVLTPALIGVDKAGHLPNASTFCGRCESVCPVRIPLPKLMRHWREREFERASVAGDRARPAWRSGRSSPGARRSTGSRRALAMRRSRGSAGATRAASPGCRSRRAGRKYRDFPAPQGATFQPQWRASRQEPADERARRRSSPTSAARSASPARKRRGAHDRRRSGLQRAPRGVDPGARPGLPARERARRSSRRRRERAVGDRRSRWTAHGDVPARQSPTSCATTICRATLRMGDDPRLAAMPWARHRARRLARAAATARISTR